MQKPTRITTPMPTIEQVAKQAGVSQKRMLEIVEWAKAVVARRPGPGALQPVGQSDAKAPVGASRPARKMRAKSPARRNGTSRP